MMGPGRSRCSLISDFIVARLQKELKGCIMRHGRSLIALKRDSKMAVQVRQALGSDAQEVARIYEPYVVNTPITFEEIAPTTDEIRERIVSTLTRFPYLVAE